MQKKHQMILTNNPKNLSRVIPLPQLGIVKAPVLQCCVAMVLLGAYTTILYLSLANDLLFTKELVIAGVVIGVLALNWKLTTTTL